MAEESASAPERERRGRLRRSLLFVLFAAVLLVPKALALRRRPPLWNGLRLAAGGAGLAGLAGAIAGRLGWLGWLVALLLLGLALLFPAQKKGKSVDEVAREMGALVVVNGGRYQGKSVRLYIGREQIHVLRLVHEPILTIPLAASLRVEAEEAKGAWRLCVEWTGENLERAEFIYEGFFAEHLARVAETTLRSQLKTTSGQRPVR